MVWARVMLLSCVMGIGICAKAQGGAMGGGWEDHENAATALRHDVDGQEDDVCSCTVYSCTAKEL